MIRVLHYKRLNASINPEFIQNRTPEIDGSLSSYAFSGDGEMEGQ